MLFIIILYIFLSINIRELKIKKNYSKILENLFIFFCLLLLFIESFNTHGFFLDKFGHSKVHWQTYIGPVELMLQGGYLLWDTPSQYGFLSTIFIYLMPFDDPWMKLYYLNALLTFSFSIILFLTIWNKGSFLWLLISFLITYSVIFLLPGGQWQYNISSTPSSGMMRFFVSVILIFLIVKLHTQPWIKQISAILPVWLLGVFWSFESAFYCSCIIFPWIIHNILFEKNLLRDKITTILVFPLSFLIILGFISLYYLAQLGNLPDYWAFAEYAFAWIINSDQMINSVPEIFTIDGSINLIIILFLILLIYSKEVLFNKYLFYSSILFLWSVNSLIIGKGTDFHINSILFLFVYIFFLLNSVVNLNYRNIYIKILSPLLIVIIIASYLNPSFIKHILQTIKNQDYNLSNVSFQNDKNMNEFIAKINSENISIITISSKYWNYNTEMYFHNNSSDIQMKVNHEKWLPVLPATLFMPISKERAKTYIRRWIERKDIDRGWLIFEHDQSFHKDIINKVNDALIDFKIEKTITYKNLKALYYEKN